MPNGTSDTFFVKRQDLSKILEDAENDLIVGQAQFLEHPSRFEAVTTCAVKQMLRDFDPSASLTPTHGDDVLVTEQDHEYFLLHLQAWVSIEKGSPLYEGILHLREAWRRTLLERFPGERS